MIKYVIYLRVRGWNYLLRDIKKYEEDKSLEEELEDRDKFGLILGDRVLRI